MTKKELNTYLDKYVEITFNNGLVKIGSLKPTLKGYLLPEDWTLFDARQVKHVKIIRERKNKTANEIKKWLLENCVDENNDINLSGLDFSDYNGHVIIKHVNITSFKVNKKRKRLLIDKMIKD